MFRVQMQMPARSMNQNWGSTHTTTIDPGGEGLSFDTNGWSIHPPAKANRKGSLPSTSVIDDSGPIRPIRSDLPYRFN